MFSRNNTGAWLVSAWCAATISWSVPTEGQLRAAALEHVRQGTQEQGITRYKEFLGSHLSKVPKVSTKDLTSLVTVADCIRFMEISEEADTSDTVAEWLLSSKERLHLLVAMIDPQDNAKACFKIIDTLRAHDAAGCDKHYELILALALVMDVPVRKPLHRQMGKETLTYKPDPMERYDYFTALYSGEYARIAYESLGVPELLFVVHVPVPLSELLWVRENVDGSLDDWGDKYTRIVYDNDRLESSRFQWDSGSYTLASIREQGGICVDQAYYAVMTARAYGIPAIYFSGSGRSANHAWFSFMKSPGDWVLDVGRYRGEEFTTGYAVNPQTWERMTDHDVEYACERSLHSDDFARASDYVSIAEVMLESHPDIAARYAKYARQRVKRYLRPWEIELQVLLAEESAGDLQAFFKEQKDVFRKYPDILADSAKQIESVLRKAGRDKEADKLMRSLAGLAGDDRDDLTNVVEFERIERIIDSGDMKKARKEMEDMLEDQIGSGNKVFWLIRKYTELTIESGQAHQAARFLPDYIKELRIRYNFPDAYELFLYECLYKIYKSDGDVKNAELMEQRLKTLKTRINR